MDDRSPGTADDLTTDALGSTSPAIPDPSLITDEVDRDLDESPDIDDPGDGFEEDLEYLIEKNAELYRRLAL